MRVVALCDGDACKESKLVDPALGKPEGWWTVRTIGQAVRGTHDHPVLEKVDLVLVVCDKCFQKLGIKTDAI